MGSKIAVFTPTRDRWAYTSACVSQLRRKAGIAGFTFDWYALDNGSMDDTRTHLWGEQSICGMKEVWWQNTNLGLSKSYNMAIDKLVDSYDYLVHVDNDAYVLSDNLLQNLVDTYTLYPVFKDTVLSPQVAGIDQQPMRHKMHLLGELGDLFYRVLGEVNNMGHLFMCVPTPIYKQFRREYGGYPDSMKQGQDTYFCAWLAQHGYRMAYVENLVVQHFEGTHAQAVRYPSYHKRKLAENS